jgi:hypothetical protein
MRRFIYGTHVLLHMSLFLFFWAISDFFYTVDASLGAVSRYCLVGSMAVYMLLSILPLIFSDCPYNTPLTNPIRISGMLLLYGCRFVLRCLKRLWCDPKEPIFPLTHRPYFKGLRFDKSCLLSFEAKNRAAGLERHAMEWLFKENDLSDNDMDRFLEGLPGYISSPQTERDQMYDYLTGDYALGRIREHFLTCATSLELSEEASISRVLCCVKSLRLIFRRSIESVQNPSDKDRKDLKLQEQYIHDIIGDLTNLCRRDVEDPCLRVALRAACIRGLVIQGFLTQLAKSEETRRATSQETRKQFLPLESLMPIYLFLQKKENVIQELCQDDKTNSMKNVLLSEGPLINLIVLANDILLIKSTSSSSLSFCWKALDILLKQLGIARTGVSESIRSRFNDIRKLALGQDDQEKQIFRVTPLLEILHTVVRGMRLSQALIDHVEYTNLAGVLFGKEPLQNGDFLEAFARYLPTYIANLPSDDGRKFMGDLVRDDDLWANLQVNLWNAQQSDRPTTDKLRIFEDCCIVIEVAFSSLEDSERVDWREPEFGSLVQQFESFIAHCFRSSFMGRATSFHVGIIRAQCSKALLTQFLSDFERDGAIFFRSQWDVASLARLFWTLGIGDDGDAAFWQPYINGGCLDEAIAPKAMAQIARDGHLLIFHTLGRLATTAAPLYGSGLNKHLEKVEKLQRKVIKDRRSRSRDAASDSVWEKLRRLRKDISDLRDISDKERNSSMYDLLRVIDEVLPPGSKEPGSSEDAERKCPIPSTLPPRKQRPRVNPWSLSFSSDSTAVDEGSSCATPTVEDTFGGASS